MGKTKTVNEDAPVTAAAATLATKSAMMTGILAAISTLSNDQLMQWFPNAMELAADISNDDAAKNAASIAMKPSAAVGSAVQEDVQSMFEGESLTEETQNKIATLVETAVNVRSAIEREKLEEEFQVKLIEESAKIQEELVEKIDSYATYAAEQWVEKNQVAVESAIQVERANKLMEGIASLLRDCSVEVPDEKVDAFEELSTKVEDLEAKLNEAVEDNVALHEMVKGKEALLLFKEISEGLTPIETDKFKKLVEDIDIDGDVDALREKLTIVREAHFKASKKPAASGLNEEIVPTEKELKEEVQKNAEERKIEDPRIAAYAQAISRASGNKFSRGPFTA